MRIFLVLALAGCIQPPPDEPPTGDPEPGWTGPGGDTIYNCGNACGSNVCARDGSCYPASQLWAVHTAWTVNGQTASATSCANHPDLFIAFHGGEAYLGFAPVPCYEGGYYIDKLPKVFTSVELGVNHINTGTYARFDGDGEAVIDLP